jgi:hypothetical protein
MAWFVCGVLTLTFVSFFCIKALQIYFELGHDQPGLAESARWTSAWAFMWSRRLDNPSLWALFAGILSAWLVTRAAAHASEHASLPAIIWTRKFKYWAWLFGMVMVSVGSYLLFTRLKHEGFWYSLNPDNAKYLDTPIPRLQQIEAALNVFAMTLCCSLVPTIRFLVDFMKNSQAPTTALLKARARLATIALGPITALATALTIFKIIKTIALQGGFAGIPVVHTLLDIISGAAGALFICSPMIISTYEIWRKSDGIRMKIMPIAGVLIWLGSCINKLDIVPPPLWLLDPSVLSPTKQNIVTVLKFFGCFGSGFFLWFTP